MITPDEIYLIDIGDEITWCDTQYPADDIEESDTVKYVKADRLQAEVEALKAVMREADEYLNINELTSIGSGSILHKKFKGAIK